MCHERTRRCLSTSANTGAFSHLLTQHLADHYTSYHYGDSQAEENVAAIHSRYRGEVSNVTRLAAVDAMVASPRGELPLGGLSMKDIVRIGDGLVLEAHPDGLYILLGREGEVDAVRIYLKEVTWPSSFGEGVSDYA